MTGRAAGRTHLRVDTGDVVGMVHPRLFGALVEHMGRCVYGGIYEPESETSTAEGFRPDVLMLTEELGVRVVRYPGGNFVSGYNWEDGVGPVSGRPTRLDLAWRSVEPNAFGLGEFISWCRVAGAEPMLAVNLGTRGIREAAELVEYCNHPSGTRIADLRAEHGHAEPFGVRLWCLGNEMDGPWQIGHKSADEYGRLAAETGKAMRLVDPSIELVVCGSSSRHMPTFGAWERTVLKHTYDVVDYISCHAYYEELAGDAASFLASSVDLEGFLLDVVAITAELKAERHTSKTIRLALDEWNVWYQSRFDGLAELRWPKAPRLIEDRYNVLDAVAVGSYLLVLLRNAAHIGVACLAQLVNVIAPIRTEPCATAWRQTTFYPLAQVARLATGTVLAARPAGPSMDTAGYGEVPLVDAVVTHHEEMDALTIFAVHRGLETPMSLDVDLGACDGYSVQEHLVLADGDVRAVNTQSEPERVRPLKGEGLRVVDGHLTAELPPASWTAIRLGARP